jgi:hypothetical protein
MAGPPDRPEVSAMPAKLNAPRNKVILPPALG